MSFSRDLRFIANLDRILRVSLALAGAAFVVGCSGPTKGPIRMALTGYVTLDEEPLRSGTIRFIPAGSGPVAVVPIKEGNYSCRPTEGAIAGNYRVEIDAGLQDDLAILAANPKAFAQHIQQHGKPAPLRPIPVEYNRQSILTAEVDDVGRQSFDFELFSSSGAGMTADGNRQ